MQLTIIEATTLCVDTMTMIGHTKALRAIVGPA